MISYIKLASDVRNTILVAFCAPEGFLVHKKRPAARQVYFVAPSDIISNLFLEDLERIWELKKWISDHCNPLLHYLKPISKKENEL